MDDTQGIGGDDAARSDEQEPNLEQEVTTEEASPVVEEPRPDVAETPGEAEPSDNPDMDWYVLKVQVNREDSIAESLERRVEMFGLDKYFGRVLVPSEMVTEVRGGRKKTTKKKLLPGYIVVQMEINQDTWYLVRETTGIGDFAGARAADKSKDDLPRPIPMERDEVDRLLSLEHKDDKTQAKLKIGFTVGERVKIIDGTFQNFEGDVQEIDETTGIVWVTINIFGRSTPVRFEYWQIEAAG